MENFEIIATCVKLVIVLVGLLQVAPIMAWAERRICAWMQNRSGPNRVGPWGLFQSIADALKFVFKEDIVPAHVRKWFYLLAPLICVAPAFMTFAVIPFGPVIQVMGRQVSLQVTDLNIGFVFVTAISSLAVYGMIMTTWSSNNKYAMLAGLRSTAQMISYELAMGLSLVAIIMQYNSVNLQEIAMAQAGRLSYGQYIVNILPNWGIFLQPLACLIFAISAFAETNRLPFDLPEGEAEIIGYHIEYGGMKWSMFFMAEYAHMTTASGLFATFFLGGWQMFPGMGALLRMIHLESQAMYWATVGMQILSFLIKVVLFMLFFIVVRFTLPRFRYDQLMRLGWKVLVPIALVNIVLTAALIAMKVY